MPDGSDIEQRWREITRVAVADQRAARYFVADWLQQQLQNGDVLHDDIVQRAQAARIPVFALTLAARLTDARLTSGGPNAIWTTKPRPTTRITILY